MLPNPDQGFTPFDPLPAAELNKMVANIEALAAGTGLDDGAVSSAKLANDSVTAAKMQYGMVRQRQGGTTGDLSWATTGTTNTDTSAKGAFMQAGSVTSSGGGAQSVTFPTPFTHAPLVFLSVQAGSNGFFAQVDTVPTTTGFSLTCWSSTSALVSKTVYWLAIGQ